MLKTKVVLTVVAIIVGLAGGVGAAVAAANGDLPLFTSSDEHSEYDPPATTPTPTLAPAEYLAKIQGYGSLSAVTPKFVDEFSRGYATH